MKTSAMTMRSLARHRYRRKSVRVASDVGGRVEWIVVSIIIAIEKVHRLNCKNVIVTDDNN